MTTVVARRLVLAPGEPVSLCARLGLSMPPGFAAEPAAVCTEGLLVDDAVHPSVAAGLVATCSPQLGVLVRSTRGDVAAAFGVRGELGGSMVRAGRSDVEVSAWPAVHLGAELRRLMPAARLGALRITVVAPPRVVGQLVWAASDPAAEPDDIGAAVAALVAAALA